MKVRVELTDGLAEDEVIIRCGRVDEDIQRIHQFVLELSSKSARLTFYKDNQEFYFPLAEVLFFETEGEYIYAHTRTDAYRIRFRLYELERMLPRNFVRASKSAIVNVGQVYTVARNLAAASLVSFSGTHKQLYASRYYYQQLRNRLEERAGNR